MARLEPEDFIDQKLILSNLNKNSINSFDLLNQNTIFTCSDDDLVLYNTSTATRHVLYEAKADKDEEFGCLRCFTANDNQNKETDFLFASNASRILLFDVNTQQQMTSFKFSRESINAIEFNRSKSLLATGDDSGEIKLLDLRVNSIQKEVLNLTLKKTLKTHSNICFALKFNPNNENELFSGSFDCSVIKWDMRYLNAKKSYVKQIQITDTLLELTKRDSDSHFSTMTPCFVHSLHLNQVNECTTLMCGIENGFCMLFDANTCDFLGHAQLQTLNCALTQICSFENAHRLVLSESEWPTKPQVETNFMVTGGDGKLIEFVYVSEQTEEKKESKLKKKVRREFMVNKLDSKQIEHKLKINCLKYLNKKMYVADTSNSLSIYDLSHFVN